MSFTGTLDKCKTCDKTVYFMDLLTVDGSTYHKSCFKCSHCKGTLAVMSLLIFILNFQIIFLGLTDRINSNINTFLWSWTLSLSARLSKSDSRILMHIYTYVCVADQQLLINGWHPLLQASFWTTF